MTGARVLTLLLLPAGNYATSVKMDFLPLGHVRTDPLLNPTCLSDHVHTFYGVNASLRPSTTYSEMRAANGNSGNVEENKSLYWHPTVYKYDPATGLYEIAPIWFASAYYVWETGQPTAFPNGFNMMCDLPSHAAPARDCNAQGASSCYVVQGATTQNRGQRRSATDPAHASARTAAAETTASFLPRPARSSRPS